MTRSTSKVFLSLALIGLLTIIPRAQNWNDSSRMAAIQSLVESHTLVIDHSVFANTGDKVFINGHFYSDKPIIPTGMGAFVYLPLSLLGIKLKTGWSLAYYLITLLTVKLFWFAGLIAFYRLLGFTGLADKERAWLTLALGIGSLYFTWSATFNNHTLAAAWLIIGFYFLLRARQAKFQRKYVFLSGLFFALAGSSDVPTSAFYAGFLVYLLADRDLRSSAPIFLLPVLLTYVPSLAETYHMSQSFMPVEMVKSYHLYPGSEWAGSRAAELAGTGINKGVFLATYSFNSLLGNRGFLLYNPLLFLAIPFWFRELKRNQPFAREARVIGAATGLIVTFYLLFSTNYGGWSYSVRWFVHLLPVWFFFMYPLMKELTPKRKALFASLFAISVIIAVIGFINPWSNASLSEFPIVANIKQVAQAFERYLGSNPAIP